MYASVTIVYAAASFATSAESVFTRPAALSAAGSTVAPFSKRCSRSARLTGWVCVRSISNGIDIFLFGPRSLRIRMWIGF